MEQANVASWQMIFTSLMKHFHETLSRLVDARLFHFWPPETKTFLLTGLYQRMHSYDSGGFVWTIFYCLRRSNHQVIHYSGLIYREKSMILLFFCYVFSFSFTVKAAPQWVCFCDLCLSCIWYPEIKASNLANNSRGLELLTDLIVKILCVVDFLSTQVQWTDNMHNIRLKELVRLFAEVQQKTRRILTEWGIISPQTSGIELTKWHLKELTRVKDGLMDREQKGETVKQKAALNQEVEWVVIGGLLVWFPSSPGCMSKYPLEKCWTCKWLLMSRLAPCMAASATSVCEWVNVTSVVKCFERSVDWKSAIEMSIYCAAEAKLLASQLNLTC